MTKQQIRGSEYINQEQRSYSLYVLHHRALPYLADGLKPAARRLLWTARDGKKYKSATLAGSTMNLHPHAAPESVVNTLAGPYLNNIPLFEGHGAFGTLLQPNAFGAGRYTSVNTSDFTKDAIFRDIELVPLIENYDSTTTEPKHFLPLIPLSLLNGDEGIAIGFATSILPRALSDIVSAQLAYLEGKTFKEPLPSIQPLYNTAVKKVLDKNGNPKWVFEGSFKRQGTMLIEVTNLPYGLAHEKFIDKLNTLIDEDVILDYDDYSKDKYDIRIKCKRGTLEDMDKQAVLNMLGLVTSISENINVINFDGESVWAGNFKTIVERFTEWRLGWYKNRYERLSHLLTEEMQRYQDILTAIAKNVGGMAKKISGRDELVDFLEEIGIVNLDYIASLPVYRFTEEEKAKVEEKLKQSQNQMKIYQKLLKSEQERRMIYITELKEVLKKYG